MDTKTSKSSITTVPKDIGIVFSKFPEYALSDYLSSLNEMNILDQLGALYREKNYKSFDLEVSKHLRNNSFSNEFLFRDNKYDIMKAFLFPLEHGSVKNIPTALTDIFLKNEDLYRLFMDSNPDGIYINVRFLLWMNSNAFQEIHNDLGMRILLESGVLTSDLLSRRINSFETLISPNNRKNVTNPKQYVVSNIDYNKMPFRFKTITSYYTGLKHGPEVTNVDYDEGEKFGNDWTVQFYDYGKKYGPETVFRVYSHFNENGDSKMFKETFINQYFYDDRGITEKDYFALTKSQIASATEMIPSLSGIAADYLLPLGTKK